MSKHLDLPMVAYDIATVLSEEWDIDVDANDVLTELEPFIRAMQARAAAHRQTGQPG